ncbi:hypothetical protein [Streptomyces hygroscopicus]|uniref:hypothetical protein n=1 Tax=Streptomyces hygroscopicus TaxID=1912 RepID=UPI002061C03E|nr:hypothetical protein HOK021_39840 [Streptomyces hygroscopicus]
MTAYSAFSPTGRAVHLTDAQQTDATCYLATHHLEGNFPGGTIDLRYQFTLRDGLIERLVIEP